MRVVVRTQEDRRMTDDRAYGPECFRGTDEGSQYDLKPLPKLRPSAEVQPDPHSEDEREVWAEVVKDMHARDLMGREKYKIPLRPHNGRDPLLDAYQEALDLCVYLKQALMERDK